MTFSNFYLIATFTKKFFLKKKYKIDIWILTKSKLRNS